MYSILRLRKKQYKLIERMILMKGYFVGNGYMGYVDGAYILFASEEEYYEFLED